MIILSVIVYVCVCAYMCVCVWIHMYLCLHMEARGQTWGLFPSSHPPSFLVCLLRQSLTALGLPCRLGWLAIELKRSAVSTSKHYCAWLFPWMPGGSLGPCGFALCTLLTVTSPQPLEHKNLEWYKNVSQILAFWKKIHFLLNVIISQIIW